MATPVPQSFSTRFDTTNTTSRSVNLPSGIEVGNLMVLHISGGNFGSNANLPSGWTQIFRQTNSSGLTPFGHILCYKVATSGDVSAGTVTVTSDSTTIRASVTRITGNYLIGNAVADRDTTNTTSKTTSHPSGISVGNLLLLGVIQNNSSGSGSITLPSGWTQGVYTVATGGAGNNFAVLLAYKTATSGDIAGSTTVTTSSNVFNRAILDIQAVENASGDATFFATEPIFFENSTSLSASGDAIFLETEPVFFNNTSRTKSKEWTNADKPTTTWT